MARPRVLSYIQNNGKPFTTRNYFIGLNLDERIILKWLLGKSLIKVLAGLIFSHRRIIELPVFAVIYECAQLSTLEVLICIW
jgi:hypothetical protein